MVQFRLHCARVRRICCSARPLKSRQKPTTSSQEQRHTFIYNALEESFENSSLSTENKTTKTHNIQFQPVYTSTLNNLGVETSSTTARQKSKKSSNKKNFLCVFSRLLFTRDSCLLLSYDCVYLCKVRLFLVNGLVLMKFYHFILLHYVIIALYTSRNQYKTAWKGTQQQILKLSK